MTPRRILSTPWDNSHSTPNSDGVPDDLGAATITARRILSGRPVSSLDVPITTTIDTALKVNVQRNTGLDWTEHVDVLTVLYNTIEACQLWDRVELDDPANPNA